MGTRPLLDKVTTIIDQLKLPYTVSEVPKIKQSSIIKGKARKVDVQVFDSDYTREPMLFIKCYEQHKSGSGQEKVFYFLAERENDINKGVPSVIIFDGSGFTLPHRAHALLSGVVHISWFEAWLRLFLFDEVSEEWVADDNKIEEEQWR